MCQPRPHTIPNPSPDADPPAPEKFQVSWKTTVSGHQESDIVLEIIRDWSPKGADRFYQLVTDNYYDCAAFFRVVPNFVVQFGIASDPPETRKWDTRIPDDPVTQSNTYGTLTFATSGPGTRTSQLFINLADNDFLDNQGFSPIGRVVQGMDVVEAIYNPTPNDSGGVNQNYYEYKGNPWLLQSYPNVDLIQGLPQ